MIEAASGRPIDELCAADVRAARDDATAFDLDHVLRARLARAWSRAPEGGFAPLEIAPPPATEFRGMGDALYSTPADYLRFLRDSSGTGRSMARGCCPRYQGGDAREPDRRAARRTDDLDLGPDQRGRPVRPGHAEVPHADRAARGGRRAGDAPRRRVGLVGPLDTHWWVDPRAGRAAVFMTQTLPFTDPRALRATPRSSGRSTPRDAQYPDHRLLVGHRARRGAHAAARAAGGCSRPAGAAEDCARGWRRRGWRAIALDLADDASVAAGAAEALARTGGRLDALFNNGAYAIPGAVEDLSRDALRAIFETNFFGQIDLTNRVLPAMRARGRGRVVMNSSVLGLVAAAVAGRLCRDEVRARGRSPTRCGWSCAGAGVQVVADRARADRDAVPGEVRPAVRALDRLARLAAPRRLRGAAADAALRARREAATGSSCRPRR